ncbi:hypothetical protein PR202_ga24080 [Eleusine coracana subsp. coracana]|uniref:Sulfotransferase n=1 Tax=Eleusine coracana subsp. coracana TaxID=191504 RepID=A0AAV5D8A8_ELECO|nr:hypothetical protein PR202_ga24080 [Eleusine coracana subsp. coracana]
MHKGPAVATHAQYWEDMLREPHGNPNTLAEFMGYEYSEEEEGGGVVDAVVQLCSLGILKKDDGEQKWQR